MIHIGARLALAVLPGLLSPSIAVAQGPEHVPVQAGTEIQLTLLETVSSETARKGQTFRLEVASDVRALGHVVIPRGTPVEGTVLRVESTGPFGRPGTLQLSIRTLQLGERQVPLYFSMLRQGKDGGGGVVVLSAVLGPLGGTVHGKAVELTNGTPLLAYVDQTFDAPVAASIAEDLARSSSQVAEERLHADHENQLEGDIHALPTPY